MAAPVGRPLIEIDLMEVERLAGLGLTKEQVADAMGIARGTYFERQKRFPEIIEAYDRGKAVTIAHVANALVNNARGGDTSAQTFYLKTQAGWNDKLTIAGDPENPIVHVISAEPLTAEEWKEKYSADDE